MTLKGDREYQITVETPHGSNSVTVYPNQHIQSVLAEVLARNDIRHNLDDYELVMAQDPLDPLDLVRSSGITDGDTLYLDSNPAGGI